MTERKKQKAGDRADFRDHAGVTMLSLTEALASALMTGTLMLYLTDYAGLGESAAAFCTVLMLVSRIFDAAMGMAAGVVMDRAGYGRFGKYRPFFLLSILATTAGLSAVFLVPDGFSGTPAAGMIWVALFYLLFSVGYSFSAPMRMYFFLTFPA